MLRIGLEQLFLYRPEFICCHQIKSECLAHLPYEPRPPVPEILQEPGVGLRSPFEKLRPSVAVSGEHMCVPLLHHRYYLLQNSEVVTALLKKISGYNQFILFRIIICFF